MKSFIYDWIWENIREPKKLPLYDSMGSFYYAIAQSIGFRFQFRFNVCNLFEPVELKYTKNIKILFSSPARPMENSLSSLTCGERWDCNIIDRIVSNQRFQLKIISLMINLFHPHILNWFVRTKCFPLWFFSLSELCPVIISSQNSIMNRILGYLEWPSWMCTSSVEPLEMWSSIPKWNHKLDERAWNQLKPQWKKTVTRWKKMSIKNSVRFDVSFVLALMWPFIDGNSR